MKKFFLIRFSSCGHFVLLLKLSVHSFVLFLGRSLPFLISVFFFKKKKKVSFFFLASVLYFSLNFLITSSCQSCGSCAQTLSLWHESTPRKGFFTPVLSVLPSFSSLCWIFPLDVSLQKHLGNSRTEWGKAFFPPYINRCLLSHWSFPTDLKCCLLPVLNFHKY